MAKRPIRLTRAPHGVEHLAWSGGKKPILASAAGRKLKLWNAVGDLVREYPDQQSTISGLQWKPHVRQLASIAYGGVTLWNPQQSEAVRRLEWRGSSLVIAWSPDGKHIATGDQDSTVHFWIISTGNDLQMSGYQTKVRELSWDATSRYLATGGSQEVTVWDCSGRGPAGTEPISLSRASGFSQRCAFSTSRKTAGLRRCRRSGLRLAIARQPPFSGGSCSRSDSGSHKPRLGTE